MDSLLNRRIALIGGAGFIGHHLAQQLKAEGAEVFVIDGLTVNNYYNFRNIQGRNSNAGLYLKIIQERLDLLGQRGIPLVVADARDYDKLSKILGQIKPDTLVHLAAVSHAGKSNKDPYSTFDHSLRTLENALDNARSPVLPIRHFVYFSSSMIYGNFASESVTEESVCEPLGIYGALKFAGEKMVIAYNQVFGLPYTIVRPSALYGPRCVSRRVGQIFIENVMSGREVCVQGDGDDKLDFTYIDDLTMGIVNVLENEDSKNQIFNLTYGQSRSINDMVEIMTKHFPGIEVKYLPKDKLMPKRGTLSIDKAREMIGYDPKYPLEAGFVRYIQWYRRYTDFIRGTCGAQLTSSGV
jgi:nucleoside-diphosphate-sugar epimerase